MQYKDYYQILGLTREASAEDIKRAYRRLARKYHPDVSKEPNAEARFKEVNEAHAVLSDPERRRTFDALGSSWQPGQDFRPPPGGERVYRQQYRFGADDDMGQFSDFFSSLFGGLGGRANEASRQRKGADQSTRISISLLEAFQGTIRQVRLDAAPVDADGRGTGSSRTLNVRIPPGVTQGQRIRLSGQGQPGMRGAPGGDLYLEVDIQPHPLYQLNGRDLQLQLPIAPWEAALGATVAVPTLSGPVNLKIPPGSQAGLKMRIKGRGLPGDPPGDEYVIPTLVLPPADSERAREFYRRMAQELPSDPRAGFGA
jgi:curved DNA-binding protein